MIFPRGMAAGLVLALGACGYTPAQLGITGPTPNPTTAVAPPPVGGNSDAQARMPGVQTDDVVYGTPSVRMP